MVQASLQWKETEAGTWTREFCPVERILHFFKHLDPTLTQWTVSSGVTLPETSNYSIETIKAAWVLLRKKHPIIACTITSENTGMQYHIPAEEGEIIKWIEETVHVDVSGKTGKELAVSMTVPKSAELYFLPKTRELLVHIRHELTDGAGSMILVNNFLKILRLMSTLGPVSPSTPSFGDEVDQLPPSLFHIVGENEPLSNELRQQAQKIGIKYLTNPSVGLKTRSLEICGTVPIPITPSGRVEHEFSEAETIAVISACRAKGITVTAAVMAAKARAILEQAGESSGNLATLVPINLRDQLPAPYNAHAGGNLFIAAFTVLPVCTDSDFVSWARDVKRELATWRCNREYVAYTKFLMKLLENGITTAMQKGVLLPSGLVLSSLGVVEKYVTEPVDDYWLNLVVSTHTANGFFVYTFKGRLRLVICYNGAYYDRDRIEDFVSMIVCHLKEGLEKY
ncbi:hypothetical protein TWF106_011094 [Orbilia oligospora]|uniref:Phthiocerol/phthiodiolone dimycocerosyl transferase C-terminal domain-containing protein n=1 Tax=Orbilia oligospora TaxID=2813651 RepID=A0A7C8URE7_ORBOL|nr:hypothetical protein TWF106_011094 [Orbilia oligospora]